MSTTITAPAQHAPVANTRKSLWYAALSGLPNLIVFTALGGLLYFGHHTGWKMPKFSALTGGTQADEDDWCPEHLVPESQCIECKPELFSREAKLSASAACMASQSALSIIPSWRK